MKFKIQKGVPVSENQVEFGLAKVIFRKKVRLLLSVLCFSFSFSSSLYDVYPSEGNIVCLFVFFFLLTEIFIATTSLATLSLQNLRLQKITIKN